MIFIWIYWVTEQRVGGTPDKSNFRWWSTTGVQAFDDALERNSKNSTSFRVVKTSRNLNKKKNWSGGRVQQTYCVFVCFSRSAEWFTTFAKCCSLAGGDRSSVRPIPTTVDGQAHVWGEQYPSLKGCLSFFKAFLVATEWMANVSGR